MGLEFHWFAMGLDSGSAGVNFVDTYSLRSLVEISLLFFRGRCCGCFPSFNSESVVLMPTKKKKNKKPVVFEQNKSESILMTMAEEKEKKKKPGNKIDKIFQGKKAKKPKESNESKERKALGTSELKKAKKRTGEEGSSNNRRKTKKKGATVVEKGPRSKVKQRRMAEGLAIYTEWPCPQSKHRSLGPLDRKDSNKEEKKANEATPMSVIKNGDAAQVPIEEEEVQQPGNGEEQGVHGLDSMLYVSSAAAERWKENGLWGMSWEVGLKRMDPSKVRILEEKWRRQLGDEMKLQMDWSKTSMELLALLDDAYKAMST